MQQGNNNMLQLWGLFSVNHFSKLSYFRYTKVVTEKAAKNVKEVLERSRKLFFSITVKNLAENQVKMVCLMLT